MNNNEILAFCKRVNAPIIVYPQFLDLTAGDSNWEFIHLVEGKYELGYFYYKKSKFGLSYITMPPLVKYMGPYTSTMPLDTLSRLYQAASAQLPKYQYFYQQFHLSWSDHPILQNIKFGDTYILNINPSEQTLLKNMKGNTRRSINKFANEISYTFNNLDGLYELATINLPSPDTLKMSKSEFNNLIEAMINQNFGFSVTLNYNQQDIACGVVAYDENTAYYLLAGNTKISGSVYPGIQAAWASIQYLKKNTKVRNFDFYGSSFPNIARIWHSMGADLQQYPILEREGSLLFKNLQRVKDWIG